MTMNSEIIIKQDGKAKACIAYPDKYDNNFTTKHGFYRLNYFKDLFAKYKNLYTNISDILISNEIGLFEEFEKGEAYKSVAKEQRHIYTADKNKEMLDYISEKKYVSIIDLDNLTVSNGNINIINDLKKYTNSYKNPIREYRILLSVKFTNIGFNEFDNNFKKYLSKIKSIYTDDRKCLFFDEYNNQFVENIY